MANTKREARFRRKARIRRKVKGTPERPRLTVFRSLKHMYAQVVDDENNQVIAAVGTSSKTLAGEFTGMKKVEQAKKLGGMVAAACKAKGVDKVVFDRNGYKYHGRVLALAKAAREGGLAF
jgi:large subunit ribosomal protein L18